ncbi:MaoC family dehydratase [Ottowia sp.]|uniref:MaoC family dehydratase n=1 Tax=Ottowia sp. TaxID=1898956 RepID=UPI003A84A2E7
MELTAHVGEEMGVSRWITLDQPRINEFAHCTEDDQWIHVDVARATKETPFGGTIAHGYLTLSLLAPTNFDVLLSRLDVKQAMNYGIDKVRFIAPVRAGKRVRNRIKMAAVEDKGDGRTLVTIENTIEIEDEEKPALIATVLAMLIS